MVELPDRFLTWNYYPRRRTFLKILNGGRADEIVWTARTVGGQDDVGYVELAGRLGGRVAQASIQQQGFDRGRDMDLWLATIDMVAGELRSPRMWPWALGAPEARVEPEEIPDMTDADRERWRRAIDGEGTLTDQGQDSGGGLTIDELLGDIDVALRDNKKEMDR